MDGPESVSKVFVSHFPPQPEGFRSGAWNHLRSLTEQVVPLYPTLVHALGHAATLASDIGITLVHENGRHEAHRSYAQIEQDVRKVAARLREIGVAPGDRVMLVLPTSFEFVIFFFAVLWIGAIPAPSYPPARFGRLDAALRKFEHILRNSGATFFVVSGPNANLLAEIPEHVDGVKMLLAEHVIAEAMSASPPPPVSAPNVLEGADVYGDDGSRWSPKSPAFIQYTSGSTGEPKGVVIEHRHVVSNIHAIGQASRITREDIVVSWLPLYHDMGLVGALLFAIYWCTPLVLLSPVTFLANPLSWLGAIGRHKGTLSPAPNFAYAHAVARVKPEDIGKLDLSSWRMAYNGAEPVNYRVVQSFNEKFAPAGFRPESMLPVYGLAESTLAVTFCRPGEALKADHVDRDELANGHVKPLPNDAPGSTPIVCVGSAIPGQTVLVCDEAGNAVPDGEVGHVIARGPSIMRGYWGNEAETNARLRDRWLWTGDLGYMREGELYVTGRASDLIIVRGKNYYAEDLESIAERVPGVRSGGAAAFGVYDDPTARDRVVVVCETKTTGAEALEALGAAVRSAVGGESGLLPDEVVLVPAGTIPRTSSGKRQRQRLKQRYVRGDVRTVGARSDLARVLTPLPPLPPKGSASVPVIPAAPRSVREPAPE